MKEPVPSFPLNGSSVDGSAAQFGWDPVAGAAGYVLQVARDESFAIDRREVDTPGTNIVTLFGMLPTDGTDYFWRVRASSEGSEWSRVERFRAGSLMGAPSRVADQSSAPAGVGDGRAAGVVATSAGDPVPTFLAESSSAGEAIAVVVVAIATIVFLLIAIPAAIG